MFASGPRAGELFWEAPFANSNRGGPLASGPAAFSMARLLATPAETSKFSGQFGRALYLSAITVTTVGFGDIVPISERSRLAVALEAVLGMVLSGLFLNAVGWRIARTKSS